jgi:hypothetical protein
VKRFRAIGGVEDGMDGAELFESENYSHPSWCLLGFVFGAAEQIRDGSDKPKKDRIMLSIGCPVWW